MKLEDTEFRCDNCFHVFNEAELVEVYSTEYPGAKAWADYVSPCCHSMNYSDLMEVK